MPYDPNMEEHLTNWFPDPTTSPWDQELSSQITHDLRHLPSGFIVWVHEDGRIFVDGHAPLSDNSRKYIESGGFVIGNQPTIGMGRVQYHLTKVAV